jgi:hypothetical protein
LKLIGKAPRGALVALAALALGVLVGACGSASSSSTSSAGGTGTTASASGGGAAGGAGANSARRAALAACLKQHGVTLPSRPAGAPGGGPAGSGAAGGGTGTNGTGTNGTGTSGTGATPRRGFFFGGGGFAANPKLRSALQACGAKVGFRGGTGARARLSHTAITKFVTCVRQHGYNLPNPNFSGKGPIFPANIQSSKTFQAASRACQNLLVPTRPPGGSSSGTSTTSGA